MCLLFLWYAMMKLKIVYMLTGCFVFIESKRNLQSSLQMPSQRVLDMSCHSRQGDSREDKFSGCLHQPWYKTWTMAGRVGNLTILSGTLSSVTWSRELSDRISTLTCVEFAWNCIKSARQLEWLPRFSSWWWVKLRWSSSTKQSWRVPLLHTWKLNVGHRAHLPQVKAIGEHAQNSPQDSSIDVYGSVSIRMRLSLTEVLSNDAVEI